MAEIILQALESDDFQQKIDKLADLKSVPPEELPKIFEKLSHDLNRDVREAGITHINLYPSGFKMFIVDPDPKIRVMLIEKSIEIRQALKEDDMVLDSFPLLVKDTYSEVRLALASCLHNHSKLVTGEEGAKIVEKRFVPLMEELLNDKSDDVRVAAAQNMKEFTIQFGYDFVIEQFYQALHDMIDDPQWRVRTCAIEVLFNFALACKIDFFEANLFSFLLLFLQDPCEKVRNYTISQLPILAIHFGGEWLNTKLMGALNDLAESKNYLYRQVYLKSICVLVGLIPVQLQSNYVFQPMIHFLNDPIDNVVLTAIDCLHQHLQAIHPFKIQHEIIPILENLAENGPMTIRQRSMEVLEHDLKK